MRFVRLASSVAIVALPFVVAAIACPATGPRLPIDCPPRDVDIDVAACQAKLGHAYGMTPSRPIRWGRIGERRPLAGRLVCPGGQEPLFEARAFDEGTDVPLPPGVRAWRAHCGSKSTTVYVDETRCGDICPPAPLRLVPVAAMRAFEDAKRLAAGGAWDAVAERCREAVKNGVPSEMIHANCGTFFYNAKRFVEARVALDMALRINPSDPFTRLHRGMVDLKEGRPEAYEAVLRDLVATLPATHQLAPELKCKLAVVMRRAGDREAGERLANEACRAGRKSCCFKPRPQSHP